VTTRQHVARAIYQAAFPGHTWESVPLSQLEYWGAIADAAMAAARSKTTGENLPLTAVLARHRYLAGLASCACNRDGYLGSLQSDAAHAAHVAQAIVAGFEVYIRKVKTTDG
jgi:hypothetical protein